MTATTDAPLRDRVSQMLDHAEISNVRVTEFSAKRFDDHKEPTQARLSSEVSYAVGEGFLGHRYVWAATFLDADESQVAEISATLVVEYSTKEGFAPDNEAAENIASTTGLFAAYPYVRELFQSCSARLQINPVVLGMLMANSTRPRNVTLTQLSGPGAHVVWESAHPQR